MSDITVSIIIVNYNTEALLGNCIQSVLDRTEGVKYEIIVVDNNSEPDSLTALQEEYPSVEFLYLNENVGFGRGNNAGAEIAKGEYLFFLNPDTILINNAVQLLYEYIQNEAKVGICGGNLYDAHQQPNLSLHRSSFYTRDLKELLHIPRHMGYNSTDAPQEVRVIMGADLLIRKELFDQINGFDPDFFLYFEEVYLCDLARQLGYKVVSVPQAKIIHLEGEATEKKGEILSKWSYREHWYSKFIYFYKTEGKTKTSLLYQLHLSKVILAKMIYRIAGNKSRIDYWLGKEQLLREMHDRYRDYLKTKCS